MGVQEGQALSSRSASASYMHHDEWSWPGSAPHSGHGSASRASRIASRLSLVRLRALASSKRRCRPFFNGQLPSVRLPEKCIGSRGLGVTSSQKPSCQWFPGSLLDDQLTIPGERHGRSPFEKTTNRTAHEFLTPARGQTGIVIATKERLDIPSCRQQ